MNKKTFRNGESVIFACVIFRDGEWMGTPLPAHVLIDNDHPIQDFKQYNEFHLVFPDVLDPKYKGYIVDGHRQSYNVFPATDEGRAAAFRRLAVVLSRRRAPLRKKLIEQISKMDRQIDGLRDHARKLLRK